MSHRILVVGGAGYIGSQAVLELSRAGHSPIILDNFAMGNRDIAAALNVPLVDGDMGDSALLDRVFTEHRPEAVMHFAAFAYVGESVTDPAKYYHNNLTCTLTLLDAMRRHGCSSFVFSSTCATYGVPERVPMTESTPQHPINPYGHSKLMVEQVLRDYEHAYNLKSVVFRYFNAAGADPQGLIGERHDPETHLIPLAIRASFDRKPLTVFGDDYPTPDGTCVRDYIHVADLAEAHILGMTRLIDTKSSAVFNLGNGQGYSVLEVIKAVETASGTTVPYSIMGRRAGDPPTLVADASKAKKELGWKPKHAELGQIVSSAYAWHRRDRERRISSPPS